MRVGLRPLTRLLVLGLSCACLSAQTPATVLESGRTVTAELRPGMPFTATLRASANQLVRIDIDPADISLTVAILGPDNAEVHRAEAISGAYGVQRFAMLTAVDGQFTVRVEPWEAAAGNFTSALRLQRRAGEHKKNWITPPNSVLGGNRKLPQSTPERPRKTGQGIEGARKHWKTPNQT